MSPPSRIQLRRTAGWRKPAGAVVVARPSRWGNPFRITPMDTTARARCVRAFADWLDTGREAWPIDDGPVRRRRLLADLGQLAGRDLACWCPLEGPCHGEVLLERANP